MIFETIEKEIIKFINEKIKDSGMNKAVIGLSGGIDSTVVAYLTAKAIGKENIISYIIPYYTTNPNNINDAKEISKILGIKNNTINIEDIVDLYFGDGYIDKIRFGNFMARLRMCILYDKAKEHNALVIGTTNKTELHLGYFTKYGDGGVDIEPIADLYKTDIFELAKYLGVPEKIINKPPSADLWNGQTDEGELGIPYNILDASIHALISYEDYSIEYMSKTCDIDMDILIKVKNIMITNFHKTEMPEKCNLEIF